MSQALTLSVKGIDANTKNRELFKFFVKQNWGYITNVEIKNDVAFVNLVNWEDKIPSQETLSLKFKDNTLSINKLNWAPRKKWKPQQFAVLTSFIDDEVGR